jgi:hypothetical protein
MRGFSAEHWLLLAGFVGSLAVQLLGDGQSWHHVTTPAFWSGVLIQVSVLIRAFFTPKPSRGGES